MEGGKDMLCRAVQGFTIVEFLVAISIAAMLAVIAAPSFTVQLERRRIVAAAETIAADLTWARGESIKRACPVSVRFANGAAWSYAISVSTASTPACAANETLKAASNADYRNIALAHNFSGNDTGFDPARGTALENGTVCLASTPNRLTLNTIVSTLGRVRICSPGGGMPGYPACAGVSPC